MMKCWITLLICLGFFGYEPYVFCSPTEPNKTDSDLRATLAPPNLVEVVRNLQNLANGRIIKQVLATRAYDEDHIILEEFYFNPRSAEAKLTRRIVAGNPTNLTYDPLVSPGNIDSGILINATGIYKIYVPTRKWSLQIEKISLDDVSEQINKMFLETQAPFPTLLKNYYSEYLSEQKLGLLAEATDSLGKIRKIKSPGESFLFEASSDEYKQEYVFQSGNLIKQAKFYNNGKLSALLVNEYVDSVDFSIKESELEGVLRPDSSLYLSAMHQIGTTPPKKLSFGMLLDHSDLEVVVKDIFRGSPAYEAKLKPGDVILSIGGKNVTGLSFDDIKVIISSGNTLDFQIKESDGTIKKVTLNKVDEIKFRNGQNALESAYPR